jgi:hypothetical protein
MVAFRVVVWLIDPLLGKDLETNNETTTVAMQRRGTHASTTIELQLETVLFNPLLGSCNNWTTTMETGIFSVCRGVILTTENEHVRGIGQGGARHRQYNGLKFGGGQAYDRSND